MSSGRERVMHNRDAQHFLRDYPQPLDSVVGRLGRYVGVVKAERPDGEIGD
jgi:hypothetical protein